MRGEGSRGPVESLVACPWSQGEEGQSGVGCEHRPAVGGGGAPGAAAAAEAACLRLVSLPVWVWILASLLLRWL